MNLSSATFVPTRGQKVYFGRSHGEQTLGEVVRVNRTRAKVKQLESRGMYKAHAVGTLWNVPFTLLSPAPEGSSPAPSTVSPERAAMEAEIARLRAENARLKMPKRPEAEVMKDILGCYSQLSPENLTCDGELPMSQVRRRAAALNRKLRELFVELGRKVSEDEAYRAAPSRF